MSGKRDLLGGLAGVVEDALLGAFADAIRAKRFPKPRDLRDAAVGAARGHITGIARDATDRIKNRVYGAMAFGKPAEQKAPKAALHRSRGYFDAAGKWHE